MDSFDLNGDRKFNMTEFSEMMRLLRKARSETLEDKRKLIQRSHRLLKRGGTEVSVRDTKSDELTLILVGAVLGLAVGYGQLVWDQKERAKLAAAEEGGGAPPGDAEGAPGVVSWYDSGQRLI